MIAHLGLPIYSLRTAIFLVGQDIGAFRPPVGFTPIETIEEVMMALQFKHYFSVEQLREAGEAIGSLTEAEFLDFVRGEESDQRRIAAKLPQVADEVMNCVFGILTE